MVIMDNDDEVCTGSGYSPSFVSNSPPSTITRQARMQSIEHTVSDANSSRIGLTPEIGQQFKNLEEVQEFYNNYARQAGFSTRISSSKLGKEKEIIRKEYCCSKEGVTRTALPSARKRGLTRECCGAKLAVVKDRSGVGGFVVKQFIKDHNHTLATPRKVHLLPSHRAVTTAKRNLALQLSEANVRPWQQMNFLEIDVGGPENVGCTRRELYNAARDRRNSLQGHDATLLLEHFEDEKKKNPNFTYAIFEEDGVMTHCFWADARCRKAYEYFGDVVVFDTTYKTNRYDLVFAPIVGVNHHGQTTLFGCALLSGETIGSFEWFLKEWLKAMPSGPPKMIITDQDPAMRNAIATVLPHTFHRYCIWHILSKFSEKISAITYKEHYDDFHSCIWESESIDEFEKRWAEVVTKANLDSNDWLNAMYEVRDRWIPTYSRHIFSAHMTSSQRVEGAHAFFKKYVSHQNSLWDFVTGLNRALAKMRNNELQLDHKDVNEKPNTVTGRGMEIQMSEWYTQNIFFKFQKQLLESGMYVVNSTQKDNQCALYSVQREDSNSKCRKLSVPKSSGFVKCSCKMFESDGIPYRHLLAYFTKKQVMRLPDQYILQRWIRSAKVSRVMDDFGDTMKEISDASVMLRRSSLFHIGSSLFDDAALSEDDTNMLKELLLSARKRIVVKRRDKGDKATNNHGIGEVDGSREKENVGESSSQMLLALDRKRSMKEPFHVRTKGCGKRFKKGKEKASKKARKCNGCGLVGQSHDKRNCPVLLGNSPSENLTLSDDDEWDNEDTENEDNEDDGVNLNDDHRSTWTLSKVE